MVVIAKARDAEREEIALFMQDVFPKAKWGMDKWREVLSGRWSGRDDSYAVTVRDEGRLVGVLGLVKATRQTGAGPRTTANMSSWYLLKEYRQYGVGRDMVEFAVREEEATITNFGSSPGAVRTVLNAGLAPLETEQLIWRAGHTVGATELVDGPVCSVEDLSAGEKQIALDHAGLNVRPAVARTPDGPCLLMVSAQHKHDDHVTHTAYHVSRPEVFRRHAPAIAGALLPQGDVLSVDRRLLGAEAVPDEVVPYDIPHFYTPGRMEPGEVDLLYSEIAILNIKL